MKPSAIPLTRPGLIGLVIAIGISIPALAQRSQPLPPKIAGHHKAASQRTTSALGGAITPSHNPFANPLNTAIPATKQQNQNPGAQKRPLIIRRNNTTQLQLEPLKKESGPAPFFDEQEGAGVRVLQVGR